MIESAFLFLGAVASLFTGNTANVTPPVQAQQANVSAVSTGPRVSLDTLPSNIERGSSVNIVWSSANVPATGKVNITLSSFTGNTPASRVLASSVLVSTGSKTVTIPPTTVPGSYKIVLTPVGVVLGSDSVLSSGEITISTISASLVPTLNKSEVKKGETIGVSWTGTNVPATTPVAVSIVNPETNAVIVAPTNTSFSTKTKTITIPKTVADQSYVAVLSAKVDGQTVTTKSEVFKVVSDAVPNAELLVFAPQAGSSFIKGTSLDLSWDFLALPVSTPIVLTFVNAESGQETAVTAPGATLSSKTRKVVIPATLASGSYKIKVTANPVGKTSVVANSPVFSVTDQVNLKASCPAVVFNKNISLGDTGEDVAALHNFMKLKKFTTSAVTGKFDTSLRTAVIAYQNSKGIYPADGVVGPATRANLNADCAGGNVNDPQLTRSLEITVQPETEVAQGSSVKVSWTSKNIPLSNVLTFKLLNIETNKETVVTPLTLTGSKTQFTVNPGTAEIYIPTTIVPGSYSVVVETVLADKTKISAKSAVKIEKAKESNVSFKNATCEKVTFTHANKPSTEKSSYEAAALSNFLISKKVPAVSFTDIYDGGLDNALAEYSRSIGLTGKDLRDTSDQWHSAYTPAAVAAINSGCRESNLAYIQINGTTAQTDILTAGKEAELTWLYTGTSKISPNETMSIKMEGLQTRKVFELAKNVKISDGKVIVSIPNTAYDYAVEVTLVPKNPKLFSKTSVLKKVYNFKYYEKSTVFDSYTFTTNIATGTVYTTGNLITVNWKASKITPGEKLKLFLQEVGTENQYLVAPQLVAQVPAANGSHTFTLPKTLPNKVYRVNISEPTAYGWQVPVSPEFSFNSNVNVLQAAKVTLNKSMAPTLYLGTTDTLKKNSARINNVVWTVSGNVNPTDKMKIYFVPKGTTVTDDKYKVWEGNVSAKKAEGVVIDEFLEGSRAKIVPGTYNLVLKPIISRLDSASVLVSNDIVVKVGSAKLTSVVPTSVKRGEKVKVTWTIAGTPAGMSIRLFPSFGKAVVVGTASVASSTGSYTFTVPKDAKLGNASVQLYVNYQADIVCGAACVIKNPTLHDYFTSTSYLDFKIVE